MSDMDGKVAEMRRKLEKKLNKWDRPIFGYIGKKIERKEGDTWEDDDGKLWEFKNGIARSITKLQDAKTPWWCPKCERGMSHRFDTKFYRLYNQCYNCTIEEHTAMKVAGTFDEFEKKMLRENEKAWLRDKIDERKDYIKTFRVPQAHYSDGGWDNLAKLEHFKEALDIIRKDIEFCETRLKAIEDEEKAELESVNE